MSADLIALTIALGLGIAVVVVGLRRDLSETTRNGLPRFEEAPGQATDAVEASEEGRRRKPLSPAPARLLAALYLLLGLSNAVDVVLSADDRAINVVLAAGFSLCAVLLLLGKPPFSSRTPT